MDKGSFYSLALALIGDRNYKPGSDEARAVEQHAQQVIATALDYARWSFATRETSLIQDASGAADLPHDCLRVQDCSLPSWRLMGRRIFSRSPEPNKAFTLSYTSDIPAQTVTLPDHEPLFCEACATLLAAAVAPRLTNNFQLAASLEQRGMEKLYRAKLRDAQATDSNDQRPPSVEELMYG